MHGPDPTRRRVRRADKFAAGFRRRKIKDANAATVGLGELVRQFGNRLRRPNSDARWNLGNLANGGPYGDAPLRHVAIRAAFDSSRSRCRAYPQGVDPKLCSLPESRFTIVSDSTTERYAAGGT